MSGFEAPRERRIITDDFSDLIEDGWTVNQPDDRRAVLIVPPGLIDPTNFPDEEVFAKLPRVDVIQIDGEPGVTAKGSVQSKDIHGNRHPAFERAKGRSTADLARRAFAAIGTDRLKFEWLSDGGELNGSDNYKAYKAEEERLIAEIADEVNRGDLEKFSEEWFARHSDISRKSVEATWTYRAARYAGFSVLAGMKSTTHISDHGPQERIEGYLEPPKSDSLTEQNLL